MTLEERLNAIPGGRWIAMVVVLFFFGGLWPLLDFAERIPKLSFWLLAHMVAAEDVKVLKLEPSTKGKAVILAVYVIAVLMLCVGIFFWAKWREKLEARFAFRHGGQLAKDTATLYRWLLSRSADLPFIESSVKRELTIKRNYDVEYVDRMTVRGDSSAPVFAIGYEIQSDERVKGGDRCEFRVRSLTDDVIVLCVPGEETLGKSRFVAVIVPPVHHTHAGIQLEAKARWPKAAKKLERIGVTDVQTFLAKKRLKMPIDEVVFSVTVELEADAFRGG